MVISAYDVQVGWKVEAGGYGNAPDGAHNEIPFITSLSIGMVAERANSTGTGKRTRRSSVVTKRADTMTIECLFDDAANSTWALAKKVDSTDELTFMIGIDTDRDGSFDNEYIYVYGAFLNSLTVNASEGEATSLTMEFSIQKADHTDSLIGGTSISAAAGEEIEAYYDTDIAYGGDLDDTNADYAGSWSVTINNNRERIYGNNAKFSYADERGGLDITGSVSKDLVGFESIADFEADDTGTITFTLHAGDTISLTGVNFDSIALDISENATIPQEIAFTADDVTLA